ncbi:hypothetical protein SLS53_005309 [Cytospora paraplurivora]|uniref:N-acetyltransferase domain-containing protein n=1 Tax=Cytospora paraplurivora TaxID=2898453 RepID=A0AAN9YG33_9PEZI
MSTASVFHFTLRTPISNGRLKLIPFNTDLHSTAFVAQSVDHPELWAHMPSNLFPTVKELNAAFLDPGSSSRFSYSNPENFTFAIIDKTRPPSPEDDEGELAGTITYANTSKTHLSSEIGPVIVLPKYQRSHVTSNAVGLLLQYAFATAEEGGLGLKRMQWLCSTANSGSIKVAERMGYEKVGTIPYHHRFPLGKRRGKVGNGRPPPKGGDPDDLWRDTIVYSLSWDIWEDSAKTKVEQAVSR